VTFANTRTRQFGADSSYTFHSFANMLSLSSFDLASFFLLTSYNLDYQTFVPLSGFGLRDLHGTVDYLKGNTSTATCTAFNGCHGDFLQILLTSFALFICLLDRNISKLSDQYKCLKVFRSINTWRTSHGQIQGRVEGSDSDFESSESPSRCGQRLDRIYLILSHKAAVLGLCIFARSV